MEFVEYNVPQANRSVEQIRYTQRIRKTYFSF